MISRRPYTPGAILSSLFGLVVGLAIVVTALPVAPAQAAGPQLSLEITHSPATFHRPESNGDIYSLNITNTGDAPTTAPVTVTDNFPTGLKVAARDDQLHSPVQPEGACAGNLGGDVSHATGIVCTRTAPLEPGESEVLSVRVAVAAGAPDTVTNEATVSGGGASSVTASDPTPVVDRPPFAVTSWKALVSDPSENDYAVAGGHPFENLTRFTLPDDDGGFTVEQMRNAGVDLPPGFFGNPASRPRCPVGNIAPLGIEFLTNCPAGSKVGFVRPFGQAEEIGGIGLYNVIPEYGYPAEFVFKVSATLVSLYATTRPRTEGYNLTIGASNANIVTFSGGGIEALRTEFCSYTDPSPAIQGCQSPPAPTQAPFLTNQVDCSNANPSWRVIVDSWKNPGRALPGGAPDLSDPSWKTATTHTPPVTGCDALEFEPGIGTKLIQGGGPAQADQPSGLSVDLEFPQTNDPTDPDTTIDPSLPQTPEPKDLTVKLPAGLAISPSSADGLGGCSDLASDPAGDQVHYDSPLPVTCPNSSQIGTVVATSPVLANHDPVTDEVVGPEPISGEIYLLKPHPGDLSQGQDGKFRLLIQLDQRRYGINFKLPGIATADKQTGQLTTVFTDNPQLPSKQLQVNLKQGPRAPLMTPITCGKFDTASDIVPWGTPDVPDATPSSSFEVKSGPDAAPCSTPEQRPFAPKLVTAGTESAKAGASSPFVLKVTRDDGEQELSSLDLTTPPGFTAKLAGIPACSDAAIAAASAKSGSAEQANPSCSASSQVGTVIAGAGPGTNPFYTQGKAYLAGPYKGAPLSFVFITPAVAGPLDLGNVVIRAATFLNSATAQVTVKTDPLPQMLDGVPLRLRSLETKLDRSDFTLNPTNCEPMSVSATVTGSNGATADPTQPFQVGDCKDLGFKPSLKLALKGPVARRSHPSLKATLTARPGDANIAAAQVKLPKAAFLDNAHIGQVCTRPQFSAHQCPTGSIYGKASATTPLLGYELTGNVYLRANPAHKLPDLVVGFNGPASQPIEIELAGKTDSVKGALRNTFEAVPDVPVSSFQLELFGGKKGLIEMSSGFCAAPDADVKFTGQNGKQSVSTPKVSAKCPKAKKAKKNKRALGHSHR